MIPAPTSPSPGNTPALPSAARWMRPLPVLLGLSLAAIPRVAAGPTRVGPRAAGARDTLSLEVLEGLSVVSEVAISPDGTRILYRLLEPVPDGVGWRGSVWELPAEGGTPRKRFDDAGATRFTPDGRTVSFLRRDGTGAQLWVAPAGGGSARQLTTHPGGVLDYAWSPDGRTLAFIGPAGGDDGSGSPQIFLQGIDDDASRRLTRVEGDVHVAFFGGGSALSWAPDGARIAFAVQRGRSFEDVYGADLYVTDVSGGPARVLVRRPGMDILPRFSPDGTHVAFVTSFGAVDRLVPHGLSVADVATGRVDDVGRSIDAAFLDAPADPLWSADGTRLFFERAIGPAVELASLTVTDGALLRLTHLEGVAAGFSFSADGRRVAFLASTPEHPFELFVSPVEDPAPVRLTHTNPRLDAIDLPPIRRVGWRNAEGGALEGLLIGRGGPRVPVVVWMHGGPEGHAVSGFDPTLPFPGVAFDPFPLRVLAARGYVVFAPNFRGSAGYGFEHRRAAPPAPAARATEDVLAGLAMLADSGWIDPDRAAIVGWASGAFKAANALTRTDRFRAAVLGAGQTDLFAAFGEGDAVVQWRSQYGGSPWEVPERYESESPLLASGRITTPTLLLHGEDDTLVPVAQTHQLHTFLRLRGIPTDFVLVSNEGHGIIHPGRRSTVARRMFAWLDRWMGDGGGEG